MVDGHLNFDTKIDQKGFTKGVKSLGSGLDSLKSKMLGIGAVIGTVFSVQAIRNFTKEAKQLWQQQEEAEVKLEAIMKQRMGATEESIKSIKDYASAQQELGVIGDEVQLAGAQQVATFVHEADSIKTLLPAMNNLLAQQKGLNATASDAVSIGNLMGKALQGQTSALTRVGISFSEAEEQVLKYGTESEKAATLAKVITNNVGEMNAALAQTDSGRMKQISNSMGDVKEQFGQAIAQIETLFIPLLSKAAQILTVAAEQAHQISQAMADLFGVQTASAVQTAGAAADAADSYEDMAEASEEAQKANDKSLASFDQINKLGAEDTAETTAETATAAQTAAISLDTAEAEKEMSAFEKKLRKILNKIKGYTSDFKDYFDENFGGIFADTVQRLSGEGQEFRDTLGRVFSDAGTLAAPFKHYLANDLTPYMQARFKTMGDIVWGLSDTFNMVFSDSWDNVIFPMLSNFVTDGLPLITQFATECWLTLDTLFLDLKELFDTGWTNFILPILTQLATVWTDTVSILKAKWDEYGPPIFAALREAITNTKDIVLKFWNKWIKPVFDKAMDVADEIWKKHLAPLLDNIVGLVGDIVQQALEIYNKAIAPIISWLIDKLAPIVTNVGSQIVDKAKSVIKLVVDTLSGFVTFLRGVFTGDSRKAWEGIKQIFGAVGTFFKEQFESARDNIKAAFSFLGSWARERFDDFKTGFSGIASWVGSKFSSAYSAATGAFSNIKTYFKNRKDDIVNSFKELGTSLKEKFSDAWDKVKSAFSLTTVRSFFNSVRDTIAGIFSDIADLIKAPFNMVIDGINSAFGTLNSLSIDIPHLDGSVTTWGFNIPEIPRLAKGMAVPANYGEFLAILGDNKRETEVVSPVSEIENAVARAMSRFGGQGGGDINLCIELDGDVVYRKVVERNKQHVDTTGKNEFIY